MTTLQEALPCPFCGSSEGLDYRDGSTHRWGVASCVSCGASAGETRREYPDVGEWHYAAMTQWNTRTALAQQGEPIAWRHSCNALCTDGLELWVDHCPHCGKPRTAAPPPPLAQQGEPVALRDFAEYIRRTGDTRLASMAIAALNSAPAPQAQECTRSHPHELMDGYCELRTEIARLTNENARLKAAPQPAQEQVTLADFRAWMHREMPADTVIGNTDWWAERIYKKFIALQSAQPVAQYDKTEMNAFVTDLYQRKSTDGQHGFYETLFHVVHKAIARVGIREVKMTYLNKDGTVAVDPEYHWRSIDRDTPRGVKLQLLTEGEVAVYGIYDGKNKFYSHWAPLPKRP